MTQSISVCHLKGGPLNAITLEVIQDDVYHPDVTEIRLAGVDPIGRDGKKGRYLGAGRDEEGRRVFNWEWNDGQTPH